MVSIFRGEALLIGSGQMPIQQDAEHTGQWDWHQTKNPIKPAEYFVSLRHKSLFAKIIFKVIDLVFFRSETQLKPTQSFVRNRTSSKMQQSKAPGGIPFNRLPHNQVVPTQSIEGGFGGAEFINGFVTEMTKHRRYDRFFLVTPQDHKSQIFRQDMPKNTSEERKRLRRQSVSSSRLAMQRIKRAHRLHRLGYLDPHVGPLGLPDTTPNPSFKPGKHPVFTV